MSMPHPFADDPNSFQGPPPNSNNTTVILVVIAVVCGTMMLICGGVIFGIVMTVRQAQQEFADTLNDEQWDSAEAQPYFSEYGAFVANGQYADAINEVDESLQSDPNNAYLHNNKAWLLATCPDDDVRDGKLAVEHATKACELTVWNNAYYIDTLAAAYAEAGDFESAVKWQEEAIRLVGPGPFIEGFEERLGLFNEEQPYREGAAPYRNPSDEAMDVESLFDAASSDESDESGTPEPSASEPTTSEPTTTTEQPQP